MYAEAGFPAFGNAARELRHWEAYNDFPRNTPWFLRFDNIFTFPEVLASLERPKACSGRFFWPAAAQPVRPGRRKPRESTVNHAHGATSPESREVSTAALQEALYGPEPASILCFRCFLQFGAGLVHIRVVVSECGDSPMRAFLKLLASAALSIGLASTAFAHNSPDFRDTDGTLMAGYKAAAGFPNGVIFSGNFVGPVSWTLTTLGNGTHHCALTGVLTGMTGGAAINAITVQFTINTVNMDRGPDGSATISGGETNREESVPEPSTLALLGTGSLALLGVMRRRSGATRN